MPERGYQGVKHYKRYAGTLLLAAVAVWVFAVVGAVKTAHHVEDFLVSAAGQGLAQSAAAVSDSLNRVLFEYALQARTFAQNPLLQTPQSETVAEYLRLVKLTVPEYMDLRITDAAGSILQATDTSLLGESEQKREWFRVFGEHGKVSSQVGPLYDVEEQTFVFAAGIVGSEGDPIGAVVLRVSVQSLEFVLEGIRRTSLQLGHSPDFLEYQLIGKDGWSCTTRCAAGRPRARRLRWA